MTDRLEWLDRDEVLFLGGIVVVFLFLAVATGGLSSSVLLGAAAGVAVYLVGCWVGHEESAETAGGDRNRRDVTIERN